jgi:hypothetical protein
LAQPRKGTFVAGNLPGHGWRLFQVPAVGFPVDGILPVVPWDTSPLDFVAPVYLVQSPRGSQITVSKLTAHKGAPSRYADFLPISRQAFPAKSRDGTTQRYQHFFGSRIYQGDSCKNRPLDFAQDIPEDFPPRYFPLFCFQGSLVP